MQRGPFDPERVRTGREPSAEVDALARQAVDAAIEIHRLLGPGFSEVVYKKAFCVEMELRGLAVQCELPTKVFYKGVEVGEGRLDALVEGKLLVEFKTVESLLPVHKAQAISYLDAVSLELGLLINFRVALLKDGIRRVLPSS
jgi:GxxExxY protein